MGAWGRKRQDAGNMQLPIPAVGPALGHTLGGFITMQAPGCTSLSGFGQSLDRDLCSCQEMGRLCGFMGTSHHRDLSTHRRSRLEYN